MMNVGIIYFQPHKLYLIVIFTLLFFLYRKALQNLVRFNISMHLLSALGIRMNHIILLLLSIALI